MMQAKDNILELKNLCISTNEGFYLKNINLHVPRNSIFTILGNNMSGKTLLMKSICGITQPDSGKVIYNSESVHFCSETQARKNGIYYFTYQPQIIPELSVIENLILGSEKKFGSYIFRNPKKAVAAIHTIMEKYDLSFDLTVRAGSLGFYQQHLISFVRALLSDCRLLILDGLIAYCSRAELISLRNFLKKITAENITVICLAQHLNSLTIESDYYYSMPPAYETTAEASHPVSASQYTESLIQKQYNQNKYPYISMNPGEVLLSAHNLSPSSSSVHMFDFSIRESEVVGITGNSIPYTEHIFNMLSGNIPSPTGKLFIKGCPVSVPKNYSFIQKNISYLSSEPSHNLVKSLDVKNNIFLSNYRPVSNKGFLSPSKMAALSYEYVTLLNMQNISFHSDTRHLSSGTQQKIAISKALNAGSVLYFFNTPTATLDTASSIDFYNIINSLKRHGRGICILSYDLDELSGVCDKIYVFKENEEVRELKRLLAY
ncbi:MAG: ATP-binding cassette domain-containing protein [Eubacteriales bacterium]|nr:ATP-binding cassette domain-containing protein [Eubacteriales bacterium]